MTSPATIMALVTTVYLLALGTIAALANDTCDHAIPLPPCSESLVDGNLSTAHNDYDPGAGGCAGARRHSSSHTAVSAAHPDAEAIQNGHSASRLASAAATVPVRSMCRPARTTTSPAREPIAQAMATAGISRAAGRA